MSFHVGQYFRIQVETNIILTGGTLLIKFIKPNTKIGQFPATINGSDDSKMYYDTINVTDIDQHGAWVFWAHATIGGKPKIGEAVEYVIKAEGQI